MTPGFSRLRREDLLKTACEVIAERGFGHTRTLDIARAAGVSQALLFYHFETKDRLFAQAFDYAARQHRETLAEIERLERPPLDRLRTLLRRCSPNGSPDGWRLWIDAWAEAMRSQDLEETSRGLDEQGRTVLRGIIEDGVASGDFVCANPEDAAWRIFSLIDGLAIHTHVHPRTLSRRRITHLVRTAAAAELGLTPTDL
ncbi:TetR family transcriptional regulator C-terminal domain-containing protein [Nonomuraea sp. NPDC048916]|uniref:TetR/AcrR family transcriptional regulator n=1 Tax=Nonomuraea sp. NPDC048916 TaxID=3154232 RepID=UPI0033FD02C7